MKQEVEKEIEKLKIKMYQAYKDNSAYEEVLHISQELDQWLNAWNELNLQKNSGQAS